MGQTWSGRIYSGTLCADISRAGATGSGPAGAACRVGPGRRSTMSINRLTSEALKEDFRRAPAVDGRGGGYSGPSFMTPEVQREVAAQSNAVTASLESLVKYIPTEAVTLYVATLSAAHLLRSLMPGFDARMIY